MPAQFFADVNALEELYDLETDPHEIHNLVDDPAYSDIKYRLWQQLMQWMRDIRDLAFIPEPELFNIDREYGNRYAYFRGPAGSELFERIWSTASVAGRPDAGDRFFLLNALKDKEASVRYWAAIGLGNLQKIGDYDKRRVACRAQRPGAGGRGPGAVSCRGYGLCTAAADTGVAERAGEWVRAGCGACTRQMGADARPAVPFLEHALRRSGKQICGAGWPIMR
ncbi:MAG: DUF4976 domain-containing protein [candidate division KSB1 bacterium]|nr:DUF4976 domain-containing protein [candidate division KSB1 bacterium]